MNFIKFLSHIFIKSLLILNHPFSLNHPFLFLIYQVLICLITKNTYNAQPSTSLGRSLGRSLTDRLSDRLIWSAQPPVSTPTSAVRIAWSITYWTTHWSAELIGSTDRLTLQWAQTGEPFTILVDHLLIDQPNDQPIDRVNGSMTESPRNDARLHVIHLIHQVH